MTINVGDTVTWTHNGVRPHTVHADNGAFNSGNRVTGQQFSYTFTTAGTFAYYCDYHGGPGGSGMSGTVVVQAAPAPATTPTPSAAAPAPTVAPTGAPPSAPPAGTAVPNVAISVPQSPWPTLAIVAGVTLLLAALGAAALAVGGGGKSR